MKGLIIIAAAVAIAINAANAAPLPEAKPDDVGFSQPGLARLDDFFAREILAKRVPGAVVAIAHDGKLVHYKAYGQLDAARGTPMPLDAVFALASSGTPYVLDRCCSTATELDGQRILGPRTVHHMISIHLGPEIKNNVANVEPHRADFGFGLGVAVRTSEGLSSVPGNPGEFTWNGASGTQFFCAPADPGFAVAVDAAPAIPPGPAALQSYCAATFAGRGFVHLNIDEQEKLLTGMEKGEVKLTNFDSRMLFKTILGNTMEGYLADPIYGGNRDKVGWNLVGFPGVRYDYRDVMQQPNQAYQLPTAAMLLAWDRAEDLRSALAAAESDPVIGPHLDRARVGAAGVSRGG